MDAICPIAYQRLLEAARLTGRLKEALRPGAEYSICRADGQTMGLGDTYPLGELFRELDDALDAVRELVEVEDG